MKKRWKILLILLAIIALLEIVSAPLEWLWPQRWGGSTYWQGDTSRKVVALTFDDGPSLYTAAVLDILNAKKIPATFFVMGRQVERHPELLRRIAAEGHEIGNHTYALAARKNILFSDIVADEIANTQKIIADVCGITPQYYRSPGGQMGRGLWEMVRAENLTVVYGALPIPPPGKDAQTQLKTIRETIHPGAIFILHDGDDGQPDSERPRATVELLPQLLTEIDSLGYDVVSLSDILKTK